MENKTNDTSYDFDTVLDDRDNIIAFSNNIWDKPLYMAYDSSNRVIRAQWGNTVKLIDYLDNVNIEMHVYLVNGDVVKTEEIPMI